MAGAPVCTRWIGQAHCVEQGGEIRFTVAALRAGGLRPRHTLRQFSSNYSTIFCNGGYAIGPSQSWANKMGGRYG